MKVYVATDVCDQHGQCVLAAPELFGFDDAGSLVHPVEVPIGLEEAARRATSVCPVRAIRVLP